MEVVANYAAAISGILTPSTSIPMDTLLCAGIAGKGYHPKNENNTFGQT